jgi:hypothetical protein
VAQDTTIAVDIAVFHQTGQSGAAPTAQGEIASCDSSRGASQRRCCLRRPSYRARVKSTGDGAEPVWMEP